MYDLALILWEGHFESDFYGAVVKKNKQKGYWLHEDESSGGFRGKFENMRLCYK